MPYLHAPNSFVTYDTKHKILFSSDLFGATSTEWDIFAKQNYAEGMKSFHVLYMPSHEILKYGMEQIEKLDIEMIAPQHGSVIKRSMVKELIECLQNLECGFYYRQSGK
jgi:flavorubredoxin